HLLAIEVFPANPELLRQQVGFGEALVARLRAAEKLIPALLDDETCRVGGGDQVIMLGDRGADQRRIGAHDFLIAARVGIPPVAGEERHQPRQGGEVVDHIGPLVEAVDQQLAEIAWKGPRVHAFALDQPGIAERGLLPGRAPIDKRHVVAAASQVDCRTDADDPGAEDDTIRLHYRCSLAQFARESRLRLSSFAPSAPPNEVARLDCGDPWSVSEPENRCAETLILSGRVFRTGKPLRTFPGNALVQADVDDPLERLDAAGEFGRQAETAGQVDLVFARAAVADDDEAHAAFAAGLELRADRGKAALAAGKHGEALAEL